MTRAKYNLEIGEKMYVDVANESALYGARKFFSMMTYRSSSG